MKKPLIQEEEPQKYSISFRIFYFLCYPAMLWIHILSKITGHGSGHYFVDKHNVPENFKPFA